MIVLAPVLPMLLIGKVSALLLMIQIPQRQLHKHYDSCIYCSLMNTWNETPLVITIF